jgi:hypothetical protein
MIKIQRAKTRDILQKLSKTTENTTKRYDSNYECCPMSVFFLVSVSSRDSGPSMSRIALEIGRRLGFREDGVGEMEMVCKWWPKWSSLNPRLLDEFIREGSAKLEGNRGLLCRFFQIDIIRPVCRCIRIVCPL